MNAMTEDDARETICWRTLHCAPGFPVGTTQTLVTAGGPCLASSRMAWRWEYETTRTKKSETGDLDHGSEGEWEKVTESDDFVWWRRRAGGFCGPAEPRVVDVEIAP